MNVESYLLRAMFVLCMVLCFGTLGSMLFSAGTHAATSFAKAAPDHDPGRASALATRACVVDAEVAPCTRMD